MTFIWRPPRTATDPSLYTPIADLARGETALIPLGGAGIWYRTFTLPAAARALYAFSPRPPPGSKGGARSWPEYFRTLSADPYQKGHLTVAKDPDDPGDARVGVSVLSLPGARPSRWTRAAPPNYWRVHRERIGSRYAGGTRLVWTYVPRGLPRGTERANLLVVLDGVTYTSAVPTPRIVQNLVRAQQMRPTIVVAVNSALGAREAELAHNPAYVRFLAEELVPSVQRRWHVGTEPRRTAIVGSSLGGLTAAYAAVAYPHVFGGVVAQSGAFLWSGSGRMDGPATLLDEYRRAPRGPARFYLNAGTFEGTRFPGTRMSLLTSVRAFRRVLRTKGYPVTYFEFEGGHDYAWWAATLGDGVRSVMSGAR